MGWDGMDGRMGPCFTYLFIVRCSMLFLCCVFVVTLHFHYSSSCRCSFSSFFISVSSCPFLILLPLFFSSSLQSMMSPSPPSSPSLRCVCVCALTSSVTPLCPSPPFPLRHPTLLHFLNTVFASTYLLPLTFPFSS